MAYLSYFYECFHEEIKKILCLFNQMIFDGCQIFILRVCLLQCCLNVDNGLTLSDWQNRIASHKKRSILNLSLMSIVAGLNQIDFQ
jgi:hypothetical protein